MDGNGRRALLEVSRTMSRLLGRRALFAAGLLILALLVAACGGGGGSSSSSTSSISGSGSSSSSSGVVEVSLKDFKFTPSDIKVKVGQKVRFVNKIGRHTSEL